MRPLSTLKIGDLFLVDGRHLYKVAFDAERQFNVRVGYLATKYDDDWTFNLHIEFRNMKPDTMVQPVKMVLENI